MQEDRLLKQQKEYENEIKLLNETIQRLENHLAEQTKQVAQVSQIKSPSLVKLKYILSPFLVVLSL